MNTEDIRATQKDKRPMVFLMSMGLLKMWNSEEQRDDWRSLAGGLRNGEKLIKAFRISVIQDEEKVCGDLLCTRETTGNHTAMEFLLCFSCLIMTT